MFGRPNHRSILERASIRSALTPRTELNQVLVFSPTGTYDDNTDISLVHKYILEQFQKGRCGVGALQKEIDRLRQVIVTSRLRAVDLRYYQDEISRLEEEIRDLSSGRAEAEYLGKIKSILEDWTEMKRREGPYFRFGENKKFSPDKLSLVRNFVQIASEFVPLSLTVKQEGHERRCPYCRKELEDEEGKVICLACGIYQDALTHDAEYNDRTHINSSSGNGYMNKETFMKTLDCFQGRQKTDFPEELRRRFDEYCRFKGKNKAVLNYELTRPIFKEIGFSGYFDDINLFLFTHPEIRRLLPDLSRVEDLILQDYDQFSSRYQELKGDERNSSLNAWYILYILCRRRKIPCNKCDLKMPDTREIRISNDNIARRVFESLGWRFEDTI